MRRLSVLMASLLVAGLVLSQTPAPAAVSEKFFSGGTGTAGWVTYTPPPPGATETLSIALYVNGSNASDYDDYAGVKIKGVGSSAPSVSPSFRFLSDTASGSSGGSPRLRILFSDGGAIDVRPLSWALNTWTTVPTSSTDYDNYGGTCGFLYGPTYATALSCHTGATVTQVHVVTDSGWLVNGGYTHYIDDIKYGSDTLSYPSRCIRDPSGSHETGPVSAPVHSLVEPVAGPLQPTVHTVNCNVVVGVLGL